MQDLQTRADIEKLIDTFYKKVVEDKTIGYFFTEVVALDWEKHIPIMYDFWESTLFHKALYKGNPMKTHIDLNQKKRLKKEHFDQWLKLFTSTVDELYKGEMAELAKTRAMSIAIALQVKIAK